jgi:alpha-beta hydrolase superfamily lysophospholipase
LFGASFENGMSFKRLVVYAAVAIAIAGCRGWLVAWAMGGYYPLRYLAFDGPAFAAIVVALVLFETGLRTILRRLVGTQSWFRQTARHALYAAILLITVFPLLLATLQFHPQRIASTGTPGDWGIKYSDVQFQSDGLRLSGWFLPARHPQAPIVLIAHGLNASKENFLPSAILTRDLGFDTFIFDFRAHGDSEGHTTTLGFEEAHDVKAAYDWIHRTHPDRPVYALGYSMGGAAVIRAAAEYGIFDRVVLDSTFSSVENVAYASLLRPLGPFAAIVWRLGRLWGWIWTGVDVGRHRPVDRIGELRGRPLLLIHGTGDAVIPYHESELLREAAGPNAELWLVDRADHVQSIQRPEYGKKVGECFGAGLFVK